MVEKDSECKSAGMYAWYAAMDAARRSADNAKNFTEKQKLKAVRVQMALGEVYACDDITITNCKKWIRVKVHNGRVKDKRGRRTLELLEEDWGKEGIIKLHTDQGIIYRVV